MKSESEDMAKNVVDELRSLRQLIDRSTRREYLNLAELIAFLGISRASIYRRVADRTLPKPIKIGGNSRWSADEVRRCLSGSRS